MYVPLYMYMSVLLLCWCDVRWCVGVGATLGRAISTLIMLTAESTPVLLVTRTTYILCTYITFVRCWTAAAYSSNLLGSTEYCISRSGSHAVFFCTAVKSLLQSVPLVFCMVAPICGYSGRLLPLPEVTRTTTSGPAV